MNESRLVELLRDDRVPRRQPRPVARRRIYTLNLVDELRSQAGARHDLERLCRLVVDRSSSASTRPTA